MTLRIDFESQIDLLECQLKWNLKKNIFLELMFEQKYTPINPCSQNFAFEVMLVYIWLFIWISFEK